MGEVYELLYDLDRAEEDIRLAEAEVKDRQKARDAILKKLAPAFRRLGQKPLLYNNTLLRPAWGTNGCLFGFYRQPIEFAHCYEADELRVEGGSDHYGEMPHVPVHPPLSEQLAAMETAVLAREWEMRDDTNGKWDGGPDPEGETQLSIEAPSEVP